MGLFDSVKDFGKDLLGGAGDLFGGALGNLFGNKNPLGGLFGGLAGGLLGGFSGSDGQMPDWMEDYYKQQAQLQGDMMQQQYGAASNILNMRPPDPAGAPYAGVGWGNQQLRNMMPGLFGQTENLFGMADQTASNAYTQLQNAEPSIGVVSSGDVVSQAQNFMNPYTENVIDAVRGDLDLARAEAIQGEENRRIGAGTYGGGRHGVADSLTNRDYMNTLARTTSGLRQEGMQSALDLAMQNVARQQGTRQDIFANKLGRAGALGNLANLYSRMGSGRFGMGAGIAEDEQARNDMHAKHQYQNEMRKLMWPITAFQAASGLPMTGFPGTSEFAGGGSTVGNIMSGAMMGAGLGNQLFGGGNRMPEYVRRVASAGIGPSSFFNF